VTKLNSYSGVHDPFRLPGGAIQFQGGLFIPLWTSAFHGALQSDYNSNV
jgi:hypothetical protein